MDNIPTGQKIPFQLGNVKLPSLRKVGSIFGFDLFIDLKGLSNEKNAEMFKKTVTALENFFNPIEEAFSIWQRIKTIWKK